MLMVRCDRCGKLEDRDYKSGPTIETVYSYLGSFDLCRECQGEVNKEAVLLGTKHSAEMEELRQRLSLSKKPKEMKKE